MSTPSNHPHDFPKTLKKVFDIEGINLDDLIATALDDPQATANENKVFRGIRRRLACRRKTNGCRELVIDIDRRGQRRA